jgi:dihydrodipicolinate reductase
MIKVGIHGSTGRVGRFLLDVVKRLYLTNLKTINIEN